MILVRTYLNNTMVKTISSNWIISDTNRAKINQLLKYQPVQSKVVKSNTIGTFEKLPLELGWKIIHKNPSGYSKRGFN